MSTTTAMRELLSSVRLGRFSAIFIEKLDILALAAICICTIPRGSPLLGLWESHYFYHTFGASESPLEYLVSPLADLGIPGYTIQEISRPLLSGSIVPFDITTYRLISIALGIVILAGFYYATRPILGNLVSLVGTGLLSVNPLFLQVQHSSTVLIASLTGYSLLLYSLMSARRGSLKLVNFQLFCAAVLVVQGYGVGRIIGVSTCAAFTLYSLWKKSPTSTMWERCKPPLALASAIGVTFILFCIIDTRNVGHIFTWRYLWPKAAEVYGTELYSGMSLSLLDTIKINIPIIVDTLLGTGSGNGNGDAALSNYYLADFRYPVGSIGITILSSIALLRTPCLLRRNSSSAEMGKVLYLCWSGLVICSAPFLISGVFLNPSDNTPVATLSSHRLVFFIVPYYILGSLGLSELIIIVSNFLKARFSCLSMVSSFVAVIVSSTFLLESAKRSWLDSSQFLDLINNQISTNEKTLDEISSQFMHYPEGKDRIYAVKASHLGLHTYYYQRAKQIREIINGAANEEFLVFNLDIRGLARAERFPPMLPYLKGHRYQSLFLSLMSSGFDGSVGRVLLLESTAKYSYMGFTRQREYSLEDANPEAEVCSSKKMKPEIRFLSLFKPKGIVTTSPLELCTAKEILSRQRIRYRVVNLK